MKCIYCNNARGSFECHSECMQEYKRRFENSLCVMCGTEQNSGKIFCQSCNSNSKYSGYPGGSA